MTRRTRLPRACGGVLMGASLLVLSPALGFGPFVVVVLAGALMGLVERLIDHVSRPELLAAGTWTLMQLGIAWGAVAFGGAQTPLLLFLAATSPSLALRFNARVAHTGAAASALLVLVPSLVDRPDTETERILPVVLVTAIAFITLMMTTLTRSDVRYREASVVDSLTGLLNRSTLHGRFADLAVQGADRGQPVSVIALDLDHFKLVNDTFGHDRGDQVLIEIARVLDQGTRSVDLLYRLGGEEFLMVLPGLDESDAAHTAERLRAAIEASKPSGTHMTASFGVASTAHDRPGDVSVTLHRADTALYRAKDLGRNRVEVAGDSVADGGVPGGGEDPPTMPPTAPDGGAGTAGQSPAAPAAPAGAQRFS